MRPATSAPLAPSSAEFRRRLWTWRAAGRRPRNWLDIDHATSSAERAGDPRQEIRVERNRTLSAHEPDAGTYSLPSARRITSGVIGTRVTRAPNGESASFTAFSTAPGAPATPPSPAPLKPPSE
jgi:hypothetical protein